MATGAIELRPSTALGYSDYVYEDGTDWLLRETWHAAISGNTFDLVRYWYANGRPSRVEVASTSGDLQYVYGYNAYYIQYTWHGRKRSPMNCKHSPFGTCEANACERCCDVCGAR